MIDKWCGIPRSESVLSRDLRAPRGSCGGPRSSGAPAERPDVFRLTRSHVGVPIWVIRPLRTRYLYTMPEFDGEFNVCGFLVEGRHFEENKLRELTISDWDYAPRGISDFAPPNAQVSVSAANHKRKPTIDCLKCVLTDVPAIKLLT